MDIVQRAKKETRIGKKMLDFLHFKANQLKDTEP
jgi:hypothetical protein